MEYKAYGKTGLQVSRFGLGGMRYPQDETEAIQMIRYAIDHGVNYLDTAYIYGNSEEITGKALQDGYREKAYLATKSPTWHITKHEDFEKFLDEELVRLRTDHIDIYLLHNLNPGHWEVIKRLDGLGFLDRMIQKGKILHKGFSIHSSLQAFQEIVDSYDWEMTQIQVNILDQHQQIGVEGLRYAAQKGLAVNIMEPLRGGSLVNNIPAEITELINTFPHRRSLVEWCFRWLYDMLEVSVILSGTSTLDQLKDNLRIFDQSHPGCMTDEEQQLIARIIDIFEAKKSIGCTECRYCAPCPKGVDIPQVFQLYNNYHIVKPNQIDRVVYRDSLLASQKGADQCTACGACIKRCPQSLNIPELLKTVHAELKFEE